MARRCDLKRQQCKSVAKKNDSGVVSPDGRWIAFLRGDNIWLRSTNDNAERPLTVDGQKSFAYGRLPGTAATAGLQSDGQSAPLVVWSPDSKMLLTERLDERSVADLFLVQEVPPEGVRPILHAYRYAFPGDANKPSSQLSIIATDTGRQIVVKHDPFPVTFVGPIADDRAWWASDGRSVYVIPREEGQHRVQLLKIDANSGVAKLLIEERGKTYVEIGGDVQSRDVKILSDGRIIWYSERSDWGHLYLYDGNGVLLHPLTSGSWKVMHVVRVDERRGKVYFTAVGREAGDPYQRHLYAVNLDGTGLRLLTPENADHDIRYAPAAITQVLNGEVPQESFSMGGSYFIDTYSRPDMPPTTVLRTESGQLVARLAQADISHLKLNGLMLPQPFHVLSADGRTVLYGTVYRPSDCNPSKRYPVIDVVYPGPQETMTPKTFRDALFAEFENSQTLAELGFIVVNIDGRGTPFRSKSFHDNSYGDLANAGNLEDHIAGIRELNKTFSYMDLERVGITGASGGGFASTRAVLAHPDFYKVAVSISGSHDWRSYVLAWLPTYQGPDDGTHYESVINAPLASKLRGKLLLIHGEMDNNVPAAQTMQVVDALIKAGKDFDMLLVPGEHHSLKGAAAYVERRRWDYFVRNLMGAEPPDVPINGEP